MKPTTKTILAASWHHRQLTYGQRLQLAWTLRSRRKAGRPARTRFSQLLNRYVFA